MPTATLATGIDCCHEVHGDPADPTIMLVHGLGSQLLAWPEAFCDLLVAEGFQVVRFDNRDSGLSTCLPEGSQYTLSDMAADVVALLDHLGVADAHVVGMSLGGMVAQTVAAEHPGRCRSMVSMASNTGNSDFGRPGGEVLEAMLVEPPDDPAARTEKEVADNRLWCSPDWYDEAHVRSLYAAYTARSPQSRGAFERQMEAAVADGNRDAVVATITVPTRVLHGPPSPSTPAAPTWRTPTERTEHTKRTDRTEQGSTPWEHSTGSASSNWPASGRDPSAG